MAGIFLNYRRGPQSVTIGALEDRLAHHFGAEQVFIDHQMKPGTSYPDELRERLRNSDVVVAVIHEGWLSEFTLARSKDWVLFELSNALTAHKPVVPVLLEAVAPPRRDQLPPEIAELAILQAARVRGETFRTDVDNLLRLLERHIAPTSTPPQQPPAAAAKPKRVGRRVAAWAAALFFLSPVLFFTDTTSSYWELFALPALVSAVALTALSLLTMIFVPVVKKVTYRTDVATGSLSLREVFVQRWPLIALGMLPLGYILLISGSGADGRWQDWEWLYLIAAVLVGTYFTQRALQRFSARDHAWPPPVNTEPATFRRAAHRLHEKLTTDPDWRGSRSLANQRTAISTYTRLGDVQQELRTRADLRLPQWVKAGHSGEITGYLGWMTSIIALDVVAVVLLVTLGSPGPRPYWFAVLSTVAALVFTAAKTVTEFYSDRREVKKWIDELAEWRFKLKPLIFPPSPGKTVERPDLRQLPPTERRG